MRDGMIGEEVRALRLANRLGRHFTKKAGDLKAQAAAGSRRAGETERARQAVVAVRERLKEIIAFMETRQSATTTFAERLSARPQRWVKERRPG